MCIRGVHPLHTPQEPTCTLHQHKVLTCIHTIPYPQYAKLQATCTVAQQVTYGQLGVLQPGLLSLSLGLSLHDKDVMQASSI